MAATVDFRHHGHGLRLGAAADDEAACDRPALDSGRKHCRLGGSHFKIWQFLNRKLARRNQVWLVRGGFDKAAACWLFLFHGWRRIGAGVGIVNGDPTLERIAQGNGLALCAGGSWTARFAPVLEQIVADAEKLTGSRPNIFIDVSQVSKLDTFGAWLIERLRRSLTQGGVEAKIAGLSANYSSLVDEVRRVKATPAVEATSVTITGMLDQIGRNMVGFGADIFVVDMLGVLVLREIGVLLVAIMVAGRSGSAYTAELGSMKMREEIDALRTMGFDPIEVLILPRMLALIIALPILAFLGAIAALYGGGLVAWLYGGVDPEAFLLRLRDAISIDHFTVGIIKAPVMAAVIGIVACVEGLAVEGSAESLGQHTTSSVVQGIFFVIVMDGVFAIFFASIGM